MEFNIEIYIYSKPYRMHVKRIYEGDSIEKFEVKGARDLLYFAITGPN